MSETLNIGQLFRIDSIQLLEQSQLKIQNCVKQLQEEQIWSRPCDSLHSIGNLILHICGNLRQWTVSGVGGLPDIRQREKEFSTEVRFSQNELLSLVEENVATTGTWMKSVTDHQLAEIYLIQGFKVNGLQAINHTVTHFVGHTHQIILLTRQTLGADYQFAWSPDQERGDLPI